MTVKHLKDYADVIYQLNQEFHQRFQAFRAREPLFTFSANSANPLAVELDCD